LKDFDRHTKASQVGAYRLLILDGHESHLSQDFKDYYLEHKILTLCMSPHPLHVLQLLDVVCFSLLKRKYSQCVKDLACKYVFYINKEDFLPTIKGAFFNVFVQANCCKAFEASGLVPLDAQVVLDCLEVWLHTLPLQPLPEDIPWQSKTPTVYQLQVLKEVKRATRSILLNKPRHVDPALHSPQSGPCQRINEVR
jgi:hypothetical protein